MQTVCFSLICTSVDLFMGIDLETLGTDVVVQPIPVKVRGGEH